MEPDTRELLDAIANSLQPVVLLADAIERAAGTTAKDAAALNGHLRRAVDALRQLRARGEGGTR